jgi:hypothetical protein
MKIATMREEIEQKQLEYKQNVHKKAAENKRL